MTLDQAIDRYTNNAEYERTHGSLQGCLEFRQLAEWLKDYKRLLEQQPCDDAIIRQAAIDIIESWLSCDDYNETERHIMRAMQSVLYDLPPVTQKSGKWIPVRERLPEDEQEILFSTKTGRVHSGKYYDDDSANQWYSHKDKCRAWNNVVSAWMPLPTPYEPQEGANE